MRYWKWLYRGNEAGRSGYRLFLDRWLLLHIIIGIVLSYLVPVSLADAANTVLLPLAAVFIGLSFAWGGNASAILQTSEIQELSKYVEGGLEEYVFVYSTAILTLLITVSLWGLAGLRLFDSVWPGSDSSGYGVVEWLMYTLSSVALRECWHVVLGAQLLLISRAKIREGGGE